MPRLAEVMTDWSYVPNDERGSSWSIVPRTRALAEDGTALELCDMPNEMLAGMAAKAAEQLLVRDGRETPKESLAATMMHLLTKGSANDRQLAAMLLGLLNVAQELACRVTHDKPKQAPQSPKLTGEISASTLNVVLQQDEQVLHTLNSVRITCLGAKACLVDIAHHRTRDGAVKGIRARMKSIVERVEKTITEVWDAKAIVNLAEKPKDESPDERPF